MPKRKNKKLYTQEVYSCMGICDSGKCPHGRWPEVNYVKYTCSKKNRLIFKDKPPEIDNSDYIPDWCPLDDVATGK